MKSFQLKCLDLFVWCRFTSFQLLPTCIIVKCAKSVYWELVEAFWSILRQDFKRNKQTGFLFIRDMIILNFLCNIVYCWLSSTSHLSLRHLWHLSYKIGHWALPRLILAVVPWRRRPPSTNTNAFFEKMKCFEGTCPWKCCKVFCALVVTVKTCVLRLTTKKGSSIFLHPWISPTPGKILRAPMTAADGAAPKTPPVRLWH